MIIIIILLLLLLLLLLVLCIICILPIFSGHKFVMLCHVDTICIHYCSFNIKNYINNSNNYYYCNFWSSSLPSDFVDKRGSKVKNTSKEDLNKFYSLSDESEEGIFMLHELYYCALNNRDLCSFIVKCTCLPPTYCTVSLVWIFYSVWLPTSGLFDVFARFVRWQESCTFSVFDLVSLTWTFQRSLSTCWWWTLIFCCE